MTAWWRPGRFAKKRKNLEARAKILAALRGYFSREDFTEVDTPALQVSPGLEPHLHPFKTEYRLPHGGERELYLCTSPEFSCKKLLAAGMERIYQLGHVFRNREGGSRHQPEFMLLEWYRTGAGYDALISDCRALLQGAARAAGCTQFHYKDFTCDPFGEAEILTVQEAFRRHAGFDLLATLGDTGKIAMEAGKIGVRVAGDDRWDDSVLRIMAEKIEPHLGMGRPCFLTDYPLPMAALARVKPGDARVAERFELYVCGLELANAFVELTDAAMQRARFEEDNSLKEKLYRYRLPVDEDFLAMLPHMPPAAGIALGVDRLVMLACGADDIRDVVWMPVAGSEE